MRIRCTSTGAVIAFPIAVLAWTVILCFILQ